MLPPGPGQPAGVCRGPRRSGRRWLGRGPGHSPGRWESSAAVIKRHLLLPLTPLSLWRFVQSPHGGGGILPSRCAVGGWVCGEPVPRSSRWPLGSPPQAPGCRCRRHGAAGRCLFVPETWALGGGVCTYVRVHGCGAHARGEWRVLHRSQSVCLVRFFSDWSHRPALSRQAACFWLFVGEADAM